MTKLPDIDIDFADRTQILNYIHGTSARLSNEKAHNTGVYFTDIPTDINGIATVDHETAEKLGYFKLDLLNVNVYEGVKDEQHLVELMTTEPKWSLLWTDPEYTQQLIHIGNYYDLLVKMKPNSIPRMAMFLAVMRPAKSHLRNRSWTEIANTVWQPPKDGSYYFKKSHSIAYAQLVVVHMNLLNTTTKNI